VSQHPSTPQQWVVFTAGPMGAGKSHTLRWLALHGLFPLNDFVLADPDVIRNELPEMKGYIQTCPLRAGQLTHREAGYMLEIVVEEGLKEGKNVLVQGSLRDADWHARYFQVGKEGGREGGRADHGCWPRPRGITALYCPLLHALNNCSRSYSEPGPPDRTCAHGSRGCGLPSSTSPPAARRCWPGEAGGEGGGGEGHEGRATGLDRRESGMKADVPPPSFPPLLPSLV